MITFEVHGTSQSVDLASDTSLLWGPRDYLRPLRRPVHGAITLKTKYNEELGKVFKITDLNGLHPLTTGARVSFTKGKTTVTDGPFIEAKEVLGGYFRLEAPSKEEVVKWAQKCPAQEGDIL